MFVFFESVAIDLKVHLMVSVECLMRGAELEAVVCTIEILIIQRDFCHFIILSEFYFDSITCNE